MKLIKFRTQNYRSVVDSGWIELDKVTGLVGINESGKSNLLLSLWKLNPVREGQIDPIADFPRDRYNEIRAMKEKPFFITAKFSINDELASQMASKTGLEPSMFNELEISRRLCGKYSWQFPNCTMQRTIDKIEISQVLQLGIDELSTIEPFQAEGNLKERMLTALNEVKNNLNVDQHNKEDLKNLIKEITIERRLQAKSSKLGPIFDDVTAKLQDLITKVSKPEPTETEGLWDLTFKNLPKFVFYSNYGNLDSEIYLPHVIENLAREDLGEKEAAKTRTLKVLFEFVNLSPEEILELGTEVDKSKLTEEAIEKDSRNKKEREILLTSASTQLTAKFKDWWKQGDYRFRFNADGNHFRIWVSDDVRPEEIELEGRSTGLQWFFSFYLVFLVESQDAHQGTILLLDEAGLSLHPLAQRDLSKFFDNLENQIIYTTHSPFLMEADQLDRVRSVFIGEDGRTNVSPDLRANPKIPSAQKSIYAVHVALGLSVSDTFLIGCTPIMVEGISDQRYLTAIKNYLIGKGKVNPTKDIVFLPSGGTGNKGVAAVVSIVTAVDEQLPRALLDSDEAGVNLKTRLLSGIYKGYEDRVKQVSDYGVISNGEIEDLIPVDEFSKIATRYLPRPAGSDEEFEEIVTPTKPIVPQIEEYIDKHDIVLADGWKVEIATKFKNRLNSLTIDATFEDRWTQIFNDFISGE